MPKKKPGQAKPNVNSAKVQAIKCNEKGVQLCESDSFQDAVNSFTKAASLDPNNAQYFANLGGAYIELGLYKDAIASYIKATKLYPNNTQYFNDLGNAYQHLGTDYLESNSYKEAIDPFIKATKANPNNDQYFANLGSLYVTIGSYKKAIDPLIIATKLDPNNAQYFANLGSLYISFGSYKKAIDTLITATKIDKTNSQYFSSLACTYIKSGLYEKAMDPYFISINCSDSVEYINNVNALINYSCPDSEKIKLIKSLIIPLNTALIKANLEVLSTKMNKADALVKYTELNKGLIEVVKGAFLKDAVKLYCEVSTDEALNKASLLTENECFTKEEHESLSNQIKEAYALRYNHLDTEEKTAQEAFGGAVEAPIPKISEKEIFKALKHSIRSNHPIEIIINLLEEYKKVESKKHKNNELFTAVKAGNLNAVKVILESKPEILNDRSKMGQSPLHYAAGLAKNEILEFLIDKSKYLGDIDIKGYSPLDYALLYNNIPGTMLLLNKGEKNSYYEKKYDEAVATQNSKQITKLQSYIDVLNAAKDNITAKKFLTEDVVIAPEGQAHDLSDMTMQPLGELPPQEE